MLSRPFHFLPLNRPLTSRSIVYRYTPKASPYDKTGYRDDYVPRPNKYHITRKPPIPEWSDPNVHWPPVLPQPTKLKGKALLQELEKEEMENIKAVRPFQLPDFRPGDVVKFHFLHSLSEGKGNSYTGIIIQKKNRNSLMGGFKIKFRAAGVETLMDVKQYSPFLANFELLHKGSGRTRSKLGYLIHKQMTPTDYFKPIVKRTIAKRSDEKVKVEKKRDLSGLKVDIAEDYLLK